MNDKFHQDLIPRLKAVAEGRCQDTLGYGLFARVMRKRMSMSRKELAEASSVPQEIIDRLEIGLLIPGEFNDETLKSIELVFNMPYDEFQEREPALFELLGTVWDLRQIAQVPLPGDAPDSSFSDMGPEWDEMFYIHPKAHIPY